nr:hypothetical protein [Candidatus Sigynarchaeum springense]
MVAPSASIVVPAQSRPVSSSLIYDDLFKNQARVPRRILQYPPREWMDVKQELEANLENAIARFMQGTESKERGTSGDLAAVDPRTHPRSDAALKVAAFKRFEQDGFLHPENLPVYYEDEARKMEEKTKQLLAVMPRIKCPGCSCEIYNFEQDKGKEIGRDALTGKIIYETVFTCTACGRKYTQQEGQAR